MCYVTAARMRQVATTLFERSERLQHDARPLARQNARQLYTLSLFFWSKQNRGSLKLPEATVEDQVDLLELVRDVLIVYECSKAQPVVLNWAVDSLLAANPVPGSLLLLQDSVEDFHDEFCGRMEGESVRASSNWNQCEEVGAAVFC